APSGQSRRTQLPSVRCCRPQPAGRFRPDAYFLALAGGSGTLRTGEIAPHLRFVKTGPESSRIELANAGQLTVNRGLVFTMSLGSLLDLRRPAVHCTRRPPAS